MAFPDDFLYQLKQANPIDTVMAQYVSTQRSGKMYKCNCPFHAEKTPSCFIYPDTQSFYCFGCGAGGDVITFIKRIENLEYIDAVKLLAERAGLSVPDRSGEEGAARRKQRILEINRETAKFYYLNLQGSDKTGLRYLMERGVQPKTVQKFGLGYAGGAWDALAVHLESLGFYENEILESGVCRQNRNGGLFDFFRNRVMFPIWDLRGNVIAFGGRTLSKEDDRKYLNSGDTPVFKKSRNLYAMQFAKNTPVRRLILAEGYMDVISIHQSGFENTVATLGTALTQEQATLMSQYADEIIIAYDSDGAGQRATHRAINLLSDAGIRTRVLKLEGAKDPDEYLKKFGAARFKLLLDRSSDAVLFELERCKDGLDLNTEQGRVEGLRRSVLMLSQIENPLQREVYASGAAKEYGVSTEVLRDQVQAQRKRSFRTEQKRQWRSIQQQTLMRDPVNPDSAGHKREAKAEEYILAYLFRNPDRLGQVSARIPPSGFVTELHRKLYQILCSHPEFETPASLSAFSEVCSDAEMGRIAGLLASYQEIQIQEADVDACIQLLLHAKTMPDAGEVPSDDSLRALVQQKNAIHWDE